MINSAVFIYYIFSKKSIDLKNSQKQIRPAIINTMVNISSFAINNDNLIPIWHAKHPMAWKSLSNEGLYIQNELSSGLTKSKNITEMKNCFPKWKGYSSAEILYSSSFL